MASTEKVLQEKNTTSEELQIDHSVATIPSMEDFSQLWQLAFDASQDMISILDTDHRIVAINQAMSRAMECKPEEAKGHHCYDLLHQCDAPPGTCPHRALLEDGNSHHSELYEENLDVWMRITVTPLYSNDNKLLGSIHISQDITQQKRSEQALRESEERYRHLSEATKEGVLLSDESTIITANQVLAEMLGYSIKELTGMNMLKFVASHDRVRLIEMLRYRRAGTNLFKCIRKDGSVFPIEAQSRAISYDGSMLYQTAIRDLTEQQRIEQERIGHERMRGVLEMAGAVCHELNQPLMALQGFVEILASETGLPDRATDQLHKMDKQIERIKNLTHKMMHVTKYETKDYAGGEKIIDLDQAAPEDDVDANQ